MDIKKKKDKETLKLALKFGEDLVSYQEILEMIEDLVPDQAKEVIRLAIDASEEGEEVSFKIVLKLKIDIEGNVDEDEGNDEDEDEDEKGSGKEKKLEIIAKMRVKAQEEIFDAEEELSEAKEKAEQLEEISKAAQELLDRAEDHLSKAKEAFDEEKYGRAFGQAGGAEKLAKNAERKIDRQEEVGKEEDEEDNDEEEDGTPTQDTTAPIISDLSAIDTTTTLIMITWLTDEPADSKVWYDISTPLVIPDSTPVVSSSDLVLNHEIALFSLTPGTIYYYVVVSTDAVGNTTSSAEEVFNTLSE